MNDFFDLGAAESGENIVVQLRGWAWWVLTRLLRVWRVARAGGHCVFFGFSGLCGKAS